MFFTTGLTRQDIKSVGAYLISRFASKLIITCTTCTELKIICSTAVIINNILDTLFPDICTAYK